MSSLSNTSSRTTGKTLPAPKACGEPPQSVAGGSRGDRQPKQTSCQQAPPRKREDRPRGTPCCQNPTAPRLCLAECWLENLCLTLLLFLPCAPGVLRTLPGLDSNHTGINRLSAKTCLTATKSHFCSNGSPRLLWKWCWRLLHSAWVSNHNKTP